MPKEENLMILRMLQDGTITAEQAAELLQAVDAPRPNTMPAPPPPPIPEMPATPDDEANETLLRARAKIAAAREKVAGMQEQLAAAEEKLDDAHGTPNPWEQVAEALKNVPGARSISDAFREVDAGRIANAARRQAKRVGRTVKSSFEEMNFDFNFKFNETLKGEATLAAPREASISMESGEVVRIKNPLGDIEAVGADIPEVRVAGTLNVWAQDLAAAEAIADTIQVRVEEGSDGASIHVESAGKNRNVSLNLKAFVPYGVRVSLMSPAGNLNASDLRGGVVLATQSGDASASKIVGSVALESMSGDLSAADVQGTVRASTASGDIQISRAAQVVVANTQSGDVTVREIRADSIQIETMSGDIQVRESGITNGLRIRSISGDVQVWLTEAIVEGNAELDMDTVSGFLSLDLHSSLTAGKVNLKSVSGDVELRLPYRTNASLSLVTRNGEIAGKLRGANESGDKNLHTEGMSTIAEILGGGAGARISIATVSGDMDVRQDVRDHGEDTTPPPSSGPFPADPTPDTPLPVEMQKLGE